MDNVNLSPFRDTYGLGKFSMAAQMAPVLVQLAIIDGRVLWIAVACGLLAWVILSPSFRWVIREGTWFWKAMLVNCLVQAAIVFGAWALDIKWLSILGLLVGFLLGTVLSQPWQRKLRETHHISGHSIS